MGILAVYDTVGIQNYIFASNKLAENVGGSKLVADIFNKLLPDVIDDVLKKSYNVTGQSKLDWSDNAALKSSLSAGIIYKGGGNAFVAFSDESKFQEITKAFLIQVNLNAPGVGIAVAAIKTEFGDTYKSDFNRLGKRLAAVKGGFNTPVFAGNQPITKQSSRTGLPVSIYREGEYLSISQLKKREKYREYTEKRASKIRDFSDLVFDKGTDSFIAVIHADGNNMGSRIKEFMDKDEFETYAEAVPAIQELSEKIDNCYKAARDRTITAFNEEYKKYLAKQRERFPLNKNLFKPLKDEPPILEIIGDGDDTTVIIGGRFALDFAARLLREIEATPLIERPFKESEPTACAGVVLFHAHYPFAEAYKLTEEICSNAKTPSREYDGSYIDFHLHQSGSVSGLRKLRDSQYTVDGKSILHRPWRVSRSDDGITPNFKWFEDNVLIFKGTEGEFPRNKTKALRNAISEGETAAGTAISQMRDRRLPALPNVRIPDKTSRYAMYYDILEQYDVYENLLNKEDLDCDK